MRKFSLKTKFYATTIAILLGLAITFHYYRYNCFHPPLRGFPGAKQNNYVTVFAEIYRTAHWGKGSGLGSDPQNAGQYISLLQQYFDDPRFNTIVDLGCGDWQIMRNIQIPANKTYIGYDVVHDLIKMNKNEFSSQNIQFYHVKSLKNLVKNHVTGDLLIVKDVLQHWPFSEIKYFIENVLPNFKYALITNQYIVDDPFYNKDHLMGPDHPLGLLSPPFNLQHSTAILEYDGPEHKQVILYVNPNLA